MKAGSGPAALAADDQTREELAHLKQGGAFLFLSFDMVNSTEFKAREPRWPFVIHRFYRDVVHEVRHVSDRFNVWKYVGDEVIFWRHLTSTDDIGQIVQGTYRAIGRVVEKLDQLEDRYGLHTRNFLGVKGTMWAAAADHVAGSSVDRHLDPERKHSNRIIRENHVMTLDSRSVLVEQANLIDFIGPEIDIGFRIAKFAHNRFLLLSAYVAWLLLGVEKTGSDAAQHAKIVAFEPLKGVWGGRPYPIAWYCDDWAHVATQFHYDEPLGSPWIARICEQRTWPLATMEKVLADTNHLDGAHALQRMIAAS
jgi:hypothetical protein